jgi:alanyl-tRNA synthetase
MAGRVAELMRQPYPELSESIGRISAVIRHEEERYEHTLKFGLKKLDEEIEAEAKTLRHITLRRKDDGTTEVASGGPLVLPGEVAFRLYDTYGISLDVLEEEGGWRGFRVDHAGFEREMERQRERAKASWKGGQQKEAAKPAYAKLRETYRTEPDFYSATSTRDARIEAIVDDGTTVNEIKSGQEADVILDRTVIYAESGGQVADTGAFYDNSQSLEVAEVKGAYYPVAGLIAHRVIAKETLRVGDRIAVVADAVRREHVKRNHTGTHLVHAALRNILGTHVKQAGSLNAPDHLRFDFSHFAGVDAAELRDIEQQVNDEIVRNNELQTDVTSLDDALASGALAFFGDKYPEANVRVVTIPDAEYPRGFYSKELCGGTHVHRAGDIGVFKIVSEQSVAAGVRRIEAITGEFALADYRRKVDELRALALKLGVPEDQLFNRIRLLIADIDSLQKQVADLKRQSAHSKLDDLVAHASTVKGVRLVAASLEGVDREGMRQLVDSLRQKLGSGVVVLGSAEDGKVSLIAGVTKDLTSKVHAGKLIQALAQKLGGKGGGRPDLAEGGGNDTSGLESALRGVETILQQSL